MSQGKREGASHRPPRLPKRGVSATISVPSAATFRACSPMPSVIDSVVFTFTVRMRISSSGIGVDRHDAGQRVEDQPVGCRTKS